MVQQSLPLSFSAVLGQEKAKKILERSLASGRIAHAYLFRGPDGVGKQLCAGIVAARINCRQNSQAQSACGTCHSCRKYLSGSHPDITLVSPDGGTIKIDRVRELCRSLSYPPYESPTRVVVIEDVHTMRPEAANSLLKTLEEPPENNLLILTAGAGTEVLATIVSRCQTVPFYGLSTAQAQDIVISQRPDLEPSAAALLSRLAEGSPGQALEFARAGLVEVLGDAVKTVQQETPASADVVSPLLLLAETLASLKENLIPLIGLLRLWVRDQMVDDPERSSGRLRFHEARLAALDMAERQLARNCNRALVCEVLLFNLQSPVPGVSF